MAKGEQIYIFYGERSNADFLVYNGFVYPENYHDAIKVKFGISNSDSYMLRLALLRKLKLPASGEYLIRADKTNPIHPSVLAFIRIFKMNEGKLKFYWISNITEIPPQVKNIIEHRLQKSHQESLKNIIHTTSD